MFLYVNYNWDVDYPMGRIVFPYQGYPVTPTREGIYPEDRSALEQLLDEYSRHRGCDVHQRVAQGIC